MSLAQIETLSFDILPSTSPVLSSRAAPPGGTSTSAAEGGTSTVSPCPLQGAGAGVGGESSLGSYRLSHTVAAPMMNYRTLVKEIRNDPVLRSYHKDVSGFVRFLQQMDKACFIVSGFDKLQNKSVTRQGLFVTRWTQIYRKRMLARLYMLDGWWKENKSPVTMLTLTTYQDGRYSQEALGYVVNIEESFRLLKDGWDKLSKILRKYVPNLTYIWIVEPHTSGYPHLHIVIFNRIPKPLQDKIRLLWAEKYQTGSKEHGVDFTVKPTDEDIASLRCYLMKYIAKGFVKTGSKFNEVNWTKEELVYNALIWKHGFRIFQPSNNLQYVMGMDKEKKNPAVYWHTGESETEHYVTGERSRNVMFVRPIIPYWLPFRDGSKPVFFFSPGVKGKQS